MQSSSTAALSVLQRGVGTLLWGEAAKGERKGHTAPRSTAVLLLLSLSCLVPVARVFEAREASCCRTTWQCPIAESSSVLHGCGSCSAAPDSSSSHPGTEVWVQLSVACTVLQDQKSSHCVAFLLDSLFSCVS